MGPRCSFCGTVDGPFQAVGGAFPLLMCTGCQAARHSSGTAGLLEPPAELPAHHRPGEPHLQWGCPLCGYWTGLPWFLEGHTDTEHPGVDGDLRAGPAAPAPGPAGGIPAGGQSGPGEE